MKEIRNIKARQTVDALLSAATSAIQITIINSQPNPPGGDREATATQKKTEMADLVINAAKHIDSITKQGGRMINFWRAVKQNRKRK